MQLTLYTDYSLRVLLYLGNKPDVRVTITEISDHYDISRNHLVKVVHNLAQLGVIQTIRGKSGGMLLAEHPENINIGTVIKKIEPHMNLLECFDDATNTCPITAACHLKGIIFKAKQSFLDVLNAYTLADLLTPQAKHTTDIPIIDITPPSTS